ncbi:MAG: WD40 repeat domain-containing protein [Candidatus Endonucleobacter bathymodioli]|uniref:WD40 repeat domain-containing protein n=1 Tax=Candidatus Endonucleibacter bathymodioli TaxID=539814 RepID=A0AA90STS2_9GAMM|nr:WD40 repeat domain-containing protein [Candidatus Endonucleobacter bathymodioli]
MVRLFVVIAIVLSGASMYSFGGLPRQQAGGEVDKKAKVRGAQKLASGTSMYSFGGTPRQLEVGGVDKKEKVRSSARELVGVTIDKAKTRGLSIVSSSANGDELDAHMSNTLSKWISGLSLYKKNILKTDPVPVNDNTIKEWAKRLTEEGDRRKFLIAYQTTKKLGINHEAFKPIQKLKFSEELKSREVNKCELVQKLGFNYKYSPLYYSFSADSHYLVTNGENASTTIIWVNEDGKWIEEAKIDNRYSARSACFSPDSRHMTIWLSDDEDSSSIKLYSLGTDKKWKEKNTFDNCLEYGQHTFSADGKYLAIIGEKFIKVFSLGAKGNWVEEVKLSNQDDVSSVYFTDDGSYLVEVDRYAKVIAVVILNKTDNLVNTKVRIPQCDNVLLGPTIWNDALYMVTQTMADYDDEFNLRCETKFTVWSLGVGGKWIEKDDVSVMDVKAVGVSVDGIHIVESGDGDCTTILSLGLDARWRKKVIVVDDEECIDGVGTPRMRVQEVKFSSNGKHLVMVACSDDGDDERVMIYSENGVGEWIKKANITDGGDASFSSDCTHMIMLGACRFWNLRKSGEWVEDIIISSSDRNLAQYDVSGDGSTVAMVMSHSDDLSDLIIWGEKKGSEQWLPKACTRQKDIIAAVFSPDGHHVLAFGEENNLKVFELESVEATVPNCSLRENDLQNK